MPLAFIVRVTQPAPENISRKSYTCTVRGIRGGDIDSQWNHFIKPTQLIFCLHFNPWLVHEVWQELLHRIMTNDSANLLRINGTYRKCRAGHPQTNPCPDLSKHRRRWVECQQHDAGKQYLSYIDRASVEQPGGKHDYMGTILIFLESPGALGAPIKYNRCRTTFSFCRLIGSRYSIAKWESWSYQWRTFQPATLSPNGFRIVGVFFRQVWT